MFRHVLPNVMGPVLVIGTLGLAHRHPHGIDAVSFLGVGVPPTQPSLGTLIRIGKQLPVFRRMVDGDLPRACSSSSSCSRSTCSATGCATPSIRS
jgi:hypothetical protein